jgi:hypothetical protein
MCVRNDSRVTLNTCLPVPTERPLSLMGLATDPRVQAFKVFDIANQSEFGAKEIRCVMQVMCVSGRERGVCLQGDGEMETRCAHVLLSKIRTSNGGPLMRVLSAWTPE